MNQRQKLIVIVGPTTSGKSELAVKIAKEFNGEIISADSRQVYKGMDIGTAKVPLIEKGDGFYYKNIRHHLINVIKPDKQFTVRQYKYLGQKAVKDIVKRKKLPIIAGGTGFYIDTLIYDLQIPKIPPQKELRQKLLEKNTEKLYKELKKLDPERAKKINKNNKQRIIRALEIIKTTGKTIPKITKPESPYNPLFIGLKYEKDKLKEKIKTRLEKRLKNKNLVQEVENLHENKISWQRLESFGLEYRYIAQYLQNKISKEKMKEKIINENYKYAKRQMTWFKRNKEIHWFNQKDKDKALTLVKEYGS